MWSHYTLISQAPPAPTAPALNNAGLDSDAAVEIGREAVLDAIKSIYIFFSAILTKCIERAVSDDADDNYSSKNTYSYNYSYYDKKSDTGKLFVQ